MSYQATAQLSAPGALLDLRADSEAQPWLSEALGVDLPRHPNTVTAKDGMQVLWLGPDHWLLRASGADEGPLEATLRRAPGELHTALTIVSDQYTVFNLTGPDSRTVLTQGCSIDLHPRNFGVGSCARCGFARTQVILQATDAAPSYDLLVESSFAGYLQLWLETAIGSVVS